MHDPIERVGCPELHPALADAPAADGVHDLVPLAPERDHLGHPLRRVLQIRIHDHHCIAAREVEPRRERQLVAEVPREKEELHTRVSRAQLAHHLAAAIRAAVVDEDELAVAIDLPADGIEAAVQLRKDLLLVLHREHERDGCHGLRVVSAGAHYGQAVIGPSPRPATTTEGSSGQSE